MIKRIHIKGYKSLRDVEVELDSLAVLVGPNAAGKSNFLDALQLLSRMVQVRSLKEAFAPPYRGNPLESFSFGTEGLEGLLNKESATFSIEVDVELSSEVVNDVNDEIRDMRRTQSAPNGSSSQGSSQRAVVVKERYLRYRIEILIQPRTGFLQVANEYLAALKPDGTPTGKRKPFLELENDHLVLRLEGQGRPTHLDRFLDHSVLSRPLYPPHYPHLVALRRELTRWFFFYFEPRERMRMANPVKEVRHIGPMGEDLAAFLNTLKAREPRRFKAVEKAVHMLIPSITGISVEVDNLGQVELQLLEGDVPIPARLVSEGTLRVLGLLTLGGARDTPSLIGFEEPENGVHPRRIELIARYLDSQSSTGQTQIIATTHSSVLADLIPVEKLYQCRKSEGQTTVEPLESWGNLAKSSQVANALEDGAQRPVSDLMLRGDLDE